MKKRLMAMMLIMVMMFAMVPTTVQAAGVPCKVTKALTCRPHPHKGWTEICELECHCMDDDQPEEWIYDGNGRPRKCPLMEVEGENNG